MVGVKRIASVSFGKDSLAMLLRLIEEGWPLDEVVFYDTGMEFRAIYAIRDRIVPILLENGITYTELRPDYDFMWKMFEKPVNGRNGFHFGYSWCGGRCRWGTTDKLTKIAKYLKGEDTLEYIGIAADEPERLKKERKGNKMFPLATWGMTEADCLSYCYKRGYDWLEDAGAGEVRLYDILARVSCWCCANKNLSELRNMRKMLPEYWKQLEHLQSRTERPMKGAGKSVFDLGERFDKEERNAKP